MSKLSWRTKLSGLFVLILGALLLFQLSPVQSAITWTRSQNPVTLNNEMYVADSWVIKDGATYKMWYTHGKRDLGLNEIFNILKGLHLTDILNDMASQNLEQLLNDLSDLVPDISTIANLLDGISTVIGYATSTDLVTWTPQNSEVLAGSGEAWNSVGAPCVIKDETTYKMWYTRVKTSPTQANLQTILTDLGGTTAEKKAAILDLINSTSTVIGYATSADGVTWTVVNNEVLAGNGEAWNSVGAPCVIIDGTTYKMWYTRVKTDFTQQDLDIILADIGNASTDQLLSILDCTTTVIGYATSTDGVTWTVVNNEVLAEGGDAWNSVADPSVVKSGSSYEMWYTRCRTDLTQANLSTLINEIASLVNPAWSILNAFETGDLAMLLDELATLNIGTIKSLLGNTNTVIAYATSADGQTWTVQNAQHHVGTSSNAWSSVAAPTVLKDGDTYRMWYTEGIGDLTTTSVLNLALGTDLPIGYAYYTPVSTGITGQVTLQAREAAPSPDWVITATAQLWQVGADRTTASPLTTCNVTTSDTGSFEITSLNPGNYDITIKGSHTLRNLVENVAITSGNLTTVAFGTLIEGDCWGTGGVPDNTADISDYSAILYSFGTMSGDGNWVETCDLNQDGVVDITDYSIVLYNFGQTGVAPF